MNAALRVLAVMDTGVVSGPARQLAGIIEPLRDRQIEVAVTAFIRNPTPSKEFVDFLLSRNARVIPIECGGRFDFGVLKKLYVALSKFQPHIIQTHSYRPTFLQMLLRLYGDRTPWIVFHHGVTAEDGKVRIYNVLEEIAVRFADRRIVIEPGQLAKGWGVPEQSVISNAVLPRHLFGDDSLTVARRAEVPLLGYIGRLSYEKGVDLLIEALAILSAAGIQAQLVIVGDGPERVRLVQLAARLGLASSVSFLGHIPSIRSLYRSLDLCVLPSRSEGVPNVLLEALSENCPVVATRVGGVPRVCSSTGAAVLADEVSASAIATAIVKALADGRSPESTEARKRVSATHSVEARVGQLEALYRSLLAGKT